MPTQPQDYSVGWICAIPLELGIARELLDEEYGNDKAPRLDTKRDDNVYTFGRIHEHNVVIACLPYGRYGVTSAAVVAKDMIRTFPAIQLGLMVGIAGGAPSPKHDIRLGDVVVSVPTPRHGGVLQYDFGKTIENGDFEMTGYLSPPPTLLLNALTNIIARHRNDGHQIRQTIAGLFLKKKRLRAEYSRPETTSDRLYATSWFRQDQIIVRQERSSDQDDPVIHYGLIASANQVMKDRKIRDALAAKHGVLCFEMEAAGLMNDFPCLVVRGICDYCDVYKNDDWHGYAAATAAAYAKELLGSIPARDVAKMRAFQGSYSTADTASQVSELLGSNKLSSPEDTFHGNLDRHGVQPARALGQVMDYEVNIVDYMNQILSSSLRNPVNEIDRSILDVAEESLEWFNDSPEFRWWISANESTYFWLHGLPGAGKTVIATCTLRNLLVSRRDMPNTHIVTISCDAGTTELGIVWSLASQFSHRIGQAPTTLSVAAVPRCPKNVSKENLSTDLWELLKAFIGLLPRGEAIFMIDEIDQLTEHERSRFLQSFNLLESRVQWGGVFRVLITSRDYPDIRDALSHYSSLEQGKEWKECLKSLYFEEWDARQNKITDVQHGGSWLSSNKHYNEWLISSRSDLLWLAGKPGSGKSTLTKLIMRQLTSESHWFDNKMVPTYRGNINRSCIVSSFYYSFRGGTTETSHELMLRSIAYQIFGQNDRLFALIRDRSRALKSFGSHWGLDDLKLALSALHYVPFEIKIFIIVDGMDESDNARREDILDFLSSLSTSAGYCTIKILIASRPESNIRPWMNRARHILLEQMNHDDIKIMVSSGMQKLGQLRQSTLDRQILATELHEQRDAFISAEVYIVENSQGVFLWVVLILKELESIIRIGGYSLDDIDDSLRRLPTELGSSDGLYAHMLARLVRLIGGSTSLEVRGRRIFAWVTFAVLPPGISVLRNVLAIPSELTNHFDHKAFDLARARPNNFEQGLHSLCGGFVEIKGTTLQLMHQTVREFLLRSDCLAKPYDMNELRGDEEIAGTCCRSIYLAFVASIVQNEADSTFSMAKELSKHLSHWDVLEYALANLTKHLDYLSATKPELLHEYASLVAQAMKQPVSYSSLLLYHWVKSQPWLQHLACPEYEIRSQACLNHVLSSAVQAGERCTVFILLALGANPTSALKTASYTGELVMMMILLNAGADPNAYEESEGTALHIASVQGHGNVVKLLIEMGADVNVHTRQHGTALQVAARQGHKEVVEILMKAGADVRAPEGPDGTALQAASKYGHDAIVRWLIDGGAEDSRDIGSLEAASEED